MIDCLEVLTIPSLASGIMITKEQASAIWNTSPPLSWPDNTPIAHAEPLDYGNFWHLAYKDDVVGSMGVLIDKADGHMNWLGSGLSLDTWIYAHRCGFSHKRYVWHIQKIQEPDRLATLLRKLRYNVFGLELTDAPLQLSFSWRGYERLEDIARADWIDYEFTVAECDWPDCSDIGTTIPAFRNTLLQHPESPSPPFP